MFYMVDNCPRCGAMKIIFNVKGAHLYTTTSSRMGRYRLYEVFAICGECKHSSVFYAKQRTETDKITNIEQSFFSTNENPVANINDIIDIDSVISPADLKISSPPEYLPPDIEAIYIEGSKCLAIGCYNAAATMYRLCLDYATKELLPPEGEDPNNKIRRSLGLRMIWMFEHGKLPIALKELAECVKDDGNDGAHEGILDEVAALDLKDFTHLLLERLYTEKERLAEAKKRREARKQ
ncbi:DUF4145 domain-containing protein [Pectobacterium sp. PL64]|uniref:DUF4145 domain-containing protein n=1 Tax=Pectobacterium sp. PL64 TaxID=2738983 RepID=UPI001F0C1CEB|nr:DUF4145 domain-containing protein [Pectobacterium sp. PL64]UMO86136.1 DUF4145 domain-containing protein [Pectobacterium sp. PL64]